MQFFKEKPLSLMIFIMLGGFSLFSLSKLVLSIVLSSLLALFLIINCIYKRKKGEPLLFFVLLLILFLSTTVLSFLYFNVFRTVPEKEAVIEAEIIGFDEYDYGSAYQIKCTRIDGARRNVRLILYTSEDYNEFTLGDIIVTKVSLSRFSRNDSYDAYRYSQGFVGEANHITTMITLVGHKEHPIQKAILLIRNIFHNYIDSIFGEDAGGFFLALLIGDRSLLSKACRLDFTRIGISHILALSGQHLAILSLLIHRLLSLCHINKKWRLSILCAFVVLYMAITGFSPSITRAGLMLIFSATAFLFGNSYDAVTGLFCSVFLFVAIQPYSITDTSLLLSAFATFGVLRALEYIENSEKKVARLLTPVIASVLISLFAMLYTSFLSVFKFSYISTYSPISSLIFSLLIEAYIYLGLFLAILGALLPIQAVAYFLYQCIRTPAYFFSSLEFGYFSTEFTLCTVFAVLLICALLYYLLYPFKHRKIAITTLIVLCFGIYFTAIIGTYGTIYKNELLYIQEEEAMQECFLMKEDGNIVFVDILPQRYKGTRQTLKTVQDEHMPHIDDYVLMGYSHDTADYLDSIFQNIKVKSLYLPLPINEDDRFLFDAILSLAKEYKISVYTFSGEEFIDLKSSKIYVTQTHGSQDEHLPIFTLEYKNAKYMYHSKGALDQFSFDTVFELYEGCQGLIFGSRGVPSDYFLNIQDLPYSVKTLIISNDINYLNPKFYERFILYGKLYARPERIALHT